MGSKPEKEEEESPGNEAEASTSVPFLEIEQEDSTQGGCWFFALIAPAPHTRQAQYVTSKVRVGIQGTVARELGVET